VATKRGEDLVPEQEDPGILNANLDEQRCEASFHRLGIECVDLIFLSKIKVPVLQL